MLKSKRPALENKMVKLEGMAGFNECMSCGKKTYVLLIDGNFICYDCIRQETAKPLYLFIKNLHQKLDDLNCKKGKLGSYCLYCDSRVYDVNGIDHDKNCIILELRDKIKQLEEEYGRKR